MTTFHVTVVTPEEQVLEGDYQYVSIPAHDGQIGIAPKRAPLLVKLGDGPLRLDDANGETAWYFVEGGFAQMSADKLTLLTDKATPADEIDTEAARKALEEAKARAATDDEAIDRRLRDQDRARGKIHTADTHGG
jgi:F-type H+-transporting ATPase subunit epsilon